MLFEIFFNSHGDFRDVAKASMFNAVFDLDAYKEYKPAFDFISEVLLPFANSFYLIPGKPINDAAIELSITETEDGSSQITEVFYDGENILQGERGWEKCSIDGGVLYDSMRYDSLIDKFSKEMMIPKKYISLQSSVDIDENSKFEFPYRHSIKRS